MAREMFVDMEQLGYSVHNRCLTSVKSAFNYLIEYEDEFNITTNPFMSIKKMTDVQCSSYLAHSEAQKLLAALDKEQNQDVADIYRVALFTSARLSNIKMMKWQEVDFSSKQWLIPSTNTKTKQVYNSHSIVMSVSYC